MRQESTQLGAGNILLALRANEAAEPSRAQAQCLADALCSALEVVRIAPPPRMTGLGRLRSTLRHREPLLALELQGEFVEQVAMYAERIQASLIVVSTSPRQEGEAVAELCRAAQRPVLAVGEWRPRSPILAATDLTSEDFPVLRRGAQLAQLLRAPLITFHNVDLLLTDALAGLPRSQLGGPVVSLQSRRDRMLEAVRLLAVPATGRVGAEPDSVRAILREAEALDAGLIVLGTHRRSAWQRALTCSVAADVVGRSKRPVLLTPVPVGGAAGPHARLPRA